MPSPNADCATAANLQAMPEPNASSTKGIDHWWDEVSHHPFWSTLIAGIVAGLLVVAIVALVRSIWASSHSKHSLGVGHADTSGSHSITSGSQPKGQPTPTASHPTKPLFFYAAHPIDFTKPGNGGLGEGGSANIAGAPFEHSIRQIYTASAISESQSVTYSIPKGYHRFQAWIGLETGGNYNQESAFPVLFEVHSINNRLAPPNKMNYGDAALHLNLDVSGQSVIVLQTKTDATNCRADCEAGAVWGNAQLTP
jgi:NPCBM/NEW2 domain